MKKKIEQVADFEGLVRVAAQTFVSVAQEAIADHGQFVVALAGGSTPKKLYSLLATDTFRPHIPWDRTHLFWGDERHVPPDHQDSNYRMAREALLTHVPLPEDHVHRIHGEMPNAENAANRYEQELGDFFQLAAHQKPRFDLVLLGMGPDGHTASLFPGTSAVHETTRLVSAPWVEKFSTFRITLTPAVLNEATPCHVSRFRSGKGRNPSIGLGRSLSTRYLSIPGHSSGQRSTHLVGRQRGGRLSSSPHGGYKPNLMSKPAHAPIAFVNALQKNTVVCPTQGCPGPVEAIEASPLHDRIKSFAFHCERCGWTEHLTGQEQLDPPWDDASLFEII